MRKQTQRAWLGNQQGEVRRCFQRPLFLRLRQPSLSKKDFRQGKRGHKTFRSTDRGYRSRLGLCNVPRSKDLVGRSLGCKASPQNTSHQGMDRPYTTQYWGYRLDCSGKPSLHKHPTDRHPLCNFRQVRMTDTNSFLRRSHHDRTPQQRRSQPRRDGAYTHLGHRSHWLGM